MDKDLAPRDKLLEVATPLFAIKGFAAVSIREIAAKAEMNSALISYHFGGKAGLYNAVVDREFIKIRAMIEDLKTSNMSARACLAAYAQRLGKLHSQSPYLLRLVTAELISELTKPSECFETVIKKSIAAVAQFLIGVINAGIEKGEFRQDVDAVNVAHALAGMINFYFISTPIAKGFMPDGEGRTEKYINQALAIFLDGLEKR